MATQYRSSPFGEAVEYPWISKADTKYNPDGLFHVNVAIDPSAEAEDFLAVVKEAAEAALAAERAEMSAGEAKKWTLYMPVVPEEDDNTGDPTGRLIASFKQNQLIRLKDGATKTVAIFVKDASGKKDVRKPVFAGSIIRVMYAMRPTKIAASKQVGVRLDFSGVQVLKLATSGGAGGGFGAVDGYHEDEVADERDQAAFDPAAPAQGADY